jgi:hypothetical protein
MLPNGTPNHGCGRCDTTTRTHLHVSLQTTCLQLSHHLPPKLIRYDGGDAMKTYVLALRSESQQRLARSVQISGRPGQAASVAASAGPVEPYYYNGLEYDVEFVAALVILVRHIIGSAQHRESESSDILVVRKV